MENGEIKRISHFDYKMLSSKNPVISRCLADNMFEGLRPVDLDHSTESVFDLIHSQPDLFVGSEDKPLTERVLTKNYKINGIWYCAGSKIKTSNNGHVQEGIPCQDVLVQSGLVFWNRHPLTIDDFGRVNSGVLGKTARIQGDTYYLGTQVSFYPESGNLKSVEFSGRLEINGQEYFGKNGILYLDPQGNVTDQYKPPFWD